MGVAAQKVNQNLPNLGFMKEVPKLSDFPVGKPNDAYAKYFIGQSPSLADSGKQKALNSLIISEFRAFLNYCLVYMLEHVFNQFRNCLLCCKSYS